MGLKYFTQYRDSFGDTREVRLYKDGFDGEPVEWISERGAVRFTRGESDGFFPDQPIIASQAQIGLILKERYDLTEFVTNRKTFYVEIFDTVFTRVIWSGWIEPWDARHDYQKPPYVINLTASCGLAHLSKKKYLNPNSTFKKTGLQIIQDCLGVIGREDLPIRVSTHMYENGFTGDSRLGLTSFEENTFRYYDDNGEALYCDVIVNNLLNHFNAEITQWNNMWVIRSIVDNATAFDTSYLDISPSPHPIAWPGTFSVNGTIAKSLDGGQIRILPPINKYRTEIDFGQQKPFFENGNMLLWNENGLIGWDFTHMTKGNPGWEQFGIGGEGSRSVLKINGKSPQPYRKKKKKKFGQILVPILTGMIGANLKNTYYDVEPSQYIESPGGSISKADKSVTISFDYETEAFSSDILISIRIPITRGNQIVNYWVDPSSSPALAGADKSTASASEAFCLIRIPPVDMGKLTDKGTIDVSGNPNYPAANWSPGSKNTDWTWTVTGVPAGEYRRIGGVNGVLVENGDLVVARVANLGGTQEQVGSYWEIIGIRNNVKKGTFSLAVSLNTTFITRPGQDFPADKVYIRFYKMADDDGKPGDWYKVYNLNGKLEGFVASEESAKYATTLERGDVTDEEADTINLISGDFTPWYVGTWTRPGSNDGTSSWRRRPPLNESLSVYRAMMKDRLCMTTKPLTVFEGKIFLLPGDVYVHYLHRLYFEDQDKTFRIVRFDYDDSQKEAQVTAVEIRYEEIPDSELKQDSYIPGSRQLNTVPGQGDGIYPSKQDSTNGRLNAEDMPLTEEELFEQIEATARLDALFEGITSLTYVAGVESEDSVDLKDFLSETFITNNENQEEEDYFDITTLVLKRDYAPAWISGVEEEDLVVTATALAPKSGQFYIDFTATDPESDFTVPIRVPVLVEENPDYVETWPPEFDPFPVLNFVLEKSTTTGFDFRDYITSGHKFLQYRFFSVPDWITSRTVVNDDFSITGEPTIIERRKITVEIWDGIAEHRPYTDEIALLVIEATEITGELLDSSAGDAKIGDLPGAFEVIPQWDTPIMVKGLHDRVLIKITGGGDLGDELDLIKDFPLADPVEDGVYNPFGDIGGTTAGVGQYAIEVTAYLGENETIKEFDLTLYDDEYLAKMRKFLTKGFDHVGEIMPDGATSFVYPGAVNARAEIHDIDFDEIYISLEKDGDVIGEQHLTDIDPLINWWFYALEEDTELDPGVYTFPVRLLKEGSDVFKRTDKFTIEGKEAEPKPLLSLGTFSPGTTNVTIIAEGIPLKGAEYDLPSNYTIVFNGFGPDVECVSGEWQFMFMRGESFAEVNIEQFTGYPQKFAYASGKTLIFGNKSSLKIGDIHQAPSRVLAKFIGRDTAGKIVGIAQADFSFRVALDPEDYSGLRFLTWKAGEEMNLLDANVPKTGRQYLMPSAGSWWTVSVRSFGGIEFDAVKVMLSKIVGGVEQVAWVFGSDYIVYHPVGSVVTELTTDDKAYIFGRDEDGDKIRVVFRVGDDVEMPLDGTDGLGFWKITMIAFLESVEVSTLSATIELIEDLEPPIKDCCSDCECEGGGEWNAGADPEW